MAEDWRRLQFAPEHVQGFWVVFFLRGALIQSPGGPKAIKKNGFPRKTLILVGIYNQQFQGTIILMVFDFQGIHFGWVLYWKTS